MHIIKKIMNTIALLTMFSIVLISCKKDAHVPPDVTLKTGAGYTSADATVAKSTDITVGINAVKKEDDMLTYNVSYAYDGAATTTTLQTFNLAGSEQQDYSKDITFTTRNQAGTEKYIFTITDKDGNIAQQQITLTVQ